MTKNATWSRTCWIALIIMINAMELTHSFADDKPIWKLRSSSSLSPLVSKLQAERNYIRHVNCRRKKNRLRCDKNLNLSPINITLKNVIDKYSYEWGKVYEPIKPCLPNKCRKALHAVSRNLPPKFNCMKFKNCKRLTRKIHKILIRFYEGVQFFTEKFKNLALPLSKRKHENTESRLKILNTFKHGLKLLKQEIKTVVTRKRLKRFRQQKRRAAPHFPLTEAATANQSFLLINEGLTLQDSMEFLNLWQKSLSNVSTCWENFRREDRPEELQGPEVGTVLSIRFLQSRVDGKSVRDCLVILTRDKYEYKRKIEYKKVGFGQVPFLPEKVVNIVIFQDRIGSENVEYKVLARHVHTTGVVFPSREGNSIANVF